jgi:hypothetical protein
MLGAREHPGVIERIDPASEKKVALELDVRDYFKRQWGSYGHWVTLIAYNDMCPLTDPYTGERFHIIGLWVRHPRQADRALACSSWYLIRDHNGDYSHGRIFDPGDTRALKSGGLRGARTICPSPFPEDKGKVLYFGGHDAAGEKRRDTAWIYRASWVEPGREAEVEDRGETDTSEEAAVAMISRNDADGDGKLSREEFPSRFRRFFERIDGDGDGYITKDELVRALRSLGGGRNR